MKAIKAVYNFLVGDMTILIGIVVALVVLLLMHFIGVLAPIRPYSGAVLIVFVLVVLGLSLRHELRP